MLLFGELVLVSPQVLDQNQLKCAWESNGKVGRVFIFLAAKEKQNAPEDQSHH